MNYTINKKNYKTFPLFEENKLPGRSYFIPFSSEEALLKTDALTERYQSDRVTLLSGDDWGFHYYPKVSEMPDVLDADSVAFDMVAVPSTWQRTGYESPCYINQKYEFPLNPPHIPEDIPVGVYRKKFTIGDASKHYLITFLGAISSLDVYLNGAYVGYSEGAHNSAEFDLDPYIKEGENELIAVVYKWSNGTYLECQDMFRENGIFRDVYLTQREDAYLKDITVTYQKSGATYALQIAVKLQGKAVLSAKLCKGGMTIASGRLPAEASSKIFLEKLAVKEWNAEEPELYELILTLEKDGAPIECARQWVGFRQVKIDGDLFLFNGQKIKMKGVNHHDTTPDKGYVMTAEELHRDVMLMKELNVNTVRTSHYPPDPMFLALCDQYGLYVVDEADIETHGCYAIRYKPNLISHDPAWADHYKDRVRRMYERDKNHPSITMWSLGNEAGGYYNQDRCYDMLRELCPQIPVHYEAVCRTKRLAYDVYSEMYTHMDQVRKIGADAAGDKYKGKPFFLCEYAHAMGLGPGGLEDYMKAFYSSDKLMGGCIWEWADHAVYHKDGPVKYTYGGDHGEKVHDSNFCVDGLMYPDRRPHTGAYEMQACYRPLRAKEKEPGVYLFKNTNAFRNADYINIHWDFLQEGVVQAGGDFVMDLAAGACKPMAISHPMPTQTENCHITFTYTEKASGVFIAREQVELHAAVNNSVLNNQTPLRLEESRDAYTIAFQNGTAVFSKATGRLESYTVNGTEYLNQNPQSGFKGLYPQIYRAPLDNDMYSRKLWDTLNFASPKLKLAKMTAQKNENQVVIRTLLKIKSTRVGTLFTAQVQYTIDGEGSVLVWSQLKKRSPFAKMLPRFGLAVELPKKYGTLTYFGRGERENLSDLNAHTVVGIYETTVAATNEPYVKPQENGMHTETRWVRVTDAAGSGLEFKNVDSFFTFSAHPYTSAQLAKCAHTEDVPAHDTTHVAIDGFMRGSGTNSCGPMPQPEHTATLKAPLEFAFIMKPVVQGDL